MPSTFCINITKDPLVILPPCDLPLEHKRMKGGLIVMIKDGVVYKRIGPTPLYDIDIFLKTVNF